jgi:oligopeptide transport system ATP-binding protein
VNNIKDSQLEEMRSATSSEALRKMKRYEAASPVISVKDLKIQFNLRGDILHAIRGVSLDIYKGESLAIVGESGSGKSVFVKSIIGLLDANGTIENGEILWNGIDLAQLKREEDWEKVRGRGIAMVMQDPMTSLNPLLSVGTQIGEAVKLHQGLRGAAAKEKVYELLADVGITEPRRRYKQYPHEFSGGMRQRVVIAIALACNPQVLICDEPTTALDVTIQAQILNLLKSLKEKYRLTTIYITHDLGVVANIADRIVVMYAGDFIEYGLTEEVFYDARHPYTWALLSSMPQLGQKGKDLVAIEGTPPNLFIPVVGDAFAPRNKQALKIDYLERPPLFKVSPTHYVRSWLLDERAPHVEPPPLYAEPTAINEYPEAVEADVTIEIEEGGGVADE